MCFSTKTHQYSNLAVASATCEHTSTQYSNLAVASATCEHTSTGVFLLKNTPVLKSSCSHQVHVSTGVLANSRQDVQRTSAAFPASQPQQVSCPECPTNTVAPTLLPCACTTSALLHFLAQQTRARYDIACCKLIAASCLHNALAHASSARADHPY